MWADAYAASLSTSAMPTLTSTSLRCTRIRQGRRRCRRPIAMICRGDEFCGVYAVFGSCGHRPARRLLDVVAVFAFAQPVLGTGGSVAMAGLGVVVLSDRRIAIRRATGLVTQVDEPRQNLREEPRPRLHRDQLARPRVAVEPSQRASRPLVADGLADQPARHRSGDRAASQTALAVVPSARAASQRAVAAILARRSQ